MSGLVKVGLWGESQPPQPKDIEGAPTRLMTIVIRYSDCIESIRFQYMADGVVKWTSVWGTNSGSTAEINFGDSEHLTEISGYYGNGNDGYMTIRSLYFVSTTNTYGPYGTYGPEYGTRFSLPVKDGKVVAFFGGVRQRLDAIGCYLKPN